MRILLNYILPLILPMAVFLLWSWLTKGRKGTQPGDIPWYAGPWFWLILAGFVLMAGVLGVTVYLGGGSPDSVYQPPRYEDGRIVPSQIK
jgi:hypothetical protein